MKKCPYCAEEIQNDAVKCKHCHEFFEVDTQPSQLYEKLSRKVVKARVNQGFPSVYLTMISIIQGVALGIFINNGFSSYKYIDLGIFSLYLAASFFLIIYVSYEYTWYVLVFRYPMAVWDTIIPFTLGALEIAPTFYYKDKFGWWFWFTILFWCGAIAYSHSLFKCKKNMFDSEEPYNLTSKTLKRNRIFCMVLGLIALIGAMLSRYGRLYGYIEVVFLIIIIGSLWSMMYLEEKFLNQFYKIFGLRTD